MLIMEWLVLETELGSSLVKRGDLKDPSARLCWRGPLAPSPAVLPTDHALHVIGDEVRLESGAQCSTTTMLSRVTKSTVPPLPQRVEVRVDVDEACPNSMFARLQAPGSSQHPLLGLPGRYM